MPLMTAAALASGGGRMVINVSSLAVLAVGGSLVLSGRLTMGAMLSVNGTVLHSANVVLNRRRVV